jgi:hypothetical protein
MAGPDGGGAFTTGPSAPVPASVQDSTSGHAETSMLRDPGTDVPVATR